MAKNKAGLEKDKKKKVPFNVLSKKGLMCLAMAGVMIASPFMLAGCSNGQDGKDGKDGTPGTIWKSGTSYTEFTDAKVGDYYIDTDDFILYQKTATDWAIVMENYGKPGSNGQDGQNGTNGTDGITPTITINDDGYWVINGVPTTTKAQGEDGENGTTPTISINADGYWVINATPTEVKAEAINGTDGKDGNTWNVGTEYPITPNNGDMFLNNQTWNVYQYNGTEWELKGNIKGVSDSEAKQEKVVDLVVFAGQSNMAGRGTANQAPTVQEGHGYEFRAVSDPTQLYTIAEPFGVNENNSAINDGTKKTGSLVSAFAESYYQYTGVPIVGVSASQGAQSINFWATGSSGLNETIARYNAAKEYLENNGYTVRHNYLVWCQGEADGAQGMSTEDYKTKLTELFNQMKTQGIEKTMVIRIGDRNNSEEIHDDIILAQTELCRESDDFVMISGKLAGVPLNEMKDEAHFTQATYNEVGTDAGKNMAYFVNTGMEPYYYDAEYNNYYPFGSSYSDDSQEPTNPGEEVVDSLVINVADPNPDYDLSSLGTISDGKLTISQGSNTNYIEFKDNVILSDDFSWTYEVVVGNFQTGPTGSPTGAGMIANNGGQAGFITVPPRTIETAGSGAQFRFRDTGNTFQIDVNLPNDYDPSQVHHFAIVYDATTKTLKAYVDKVECTITYTKGSESNIVFNDTVLSRFLGGYNSANSNFAGDFYYFAFTKDVLETSEMYSVTLNN